jgi:hypothetical protein
MLGIEALEDIRKYRPGRMDIESTETMFTMMTGRAFMATALWAADWKCSDYRHRPDEQDPTRWVLF